MQAYSDPKRESEPTALPDIEMFEITESTPAEDCPMCVAAGDDEGPAIHDADCHGWYWWPCVPGCLPDGDPVGPFESEAEALADAREGMED